MCAADGVQRNLERVRRRIEAACQRAGRPASAVTLVGVIKGVAVEVIREAVALGLAELGENRVQEARAKQLVLGSRFEVRGKDFSLEPRTLNLEPVRWHLIGHLQRNKAKLAAQLFDVVHSADSLPLIEELARARAAAGPGSPPLEVFVQVNVSGEATKFGCRQEDATALASAVQESHALALRGLMTMAPFSENPEDARPHFHRLRRLRDDVASTLSLEPSTLNLSMGMSQDFEVAIEEGADLVRIGTAVFGPREAG